MLGMWQLRPAERIHDFGVGTSPGDGYRTVNYLSPSPAVSTVAD